MFRARLKRAGVGALHADVVADLFFRVETRDTDSDWWWRFQTCKPRLGRGVMDLITGPRGTGKTTLASTLVGCCCWRDQSCRVMTERRLLDEIKSSFGASEQRTAEIRRRLRSYDLLVIDEIGRADATPWSALELEDLLDARYHDRRDTVLVTNTRPEALSEVLTDSVVRRIDERGISVLLDQTMYTPESLTCSIHESKTASTNSNPNADTRRTA